MTSQPYQEPGPTGHPFKPTPDPFAVGKIGDTGSNGGAIPHPAPMPDKSGI